MVPGSKRKHSAKHPSTEKEMRPEAKVNAIRGKVARSLDKVPNQRGDVRVGANKKRPFNRSRAVGGPGGSAHKTKGTGKKKCKCKG